MKYLSILAVAFIGAIVFMTSCGKGDNGSHCQFLSPAFILVNYTEQEMDTLILRRYEKNNNFSNLLDTLMLSKAEITYKKVGDDSVSVTSNKDGYVKFAAELYENDWEIYVPATQTTGRITEVNAQFLSKTDPGEECKSFAKSMRVDGFKKEYATWFGDDYRFFIVKDN